MDRDFDEFVGDASARLRRAFLGTRGVDDADDATAEAVAYAWEHWEALRTMENPIGYLFRVAQSRTRQRRSPNLPLAETVGAVDVEPALVPALLELSPQQRTAVWLVHACDWSYREVAEALGVTVSSVGTHVARGLKHLRQRLEVDTVA